MTRALIFLRRWWAVMLAWAGLVGVGIWYILRPHVPDEPPRARLDAARNRADDKIAVANARAAVEIAVLRGKDQQQRDQLEAILDDKDETRRQNALVEMAARIRRDAL